MDTTAKSLSIPLGLRVTIAANRQMLACVPRPSGGDIGWKVELGS